MPCLHIKPVPPMYPTTSVHPVYAIRTYLSIFGLGPLEYLGLIFVEFGGESVCGLVQGGDFVEVVLQLGRKVAADRHELLLPSRVRLSYRARTEGGGRTPSTALVLYVVTQEFEAAAVSITAVGIRVQIA